MLRKTGYPEEIRRDGACDGCGKRSAELKCAASLGYNNWICPECERRLRERIRKRSIIAGEHTEPAE